MSCVSREALPGERVGLLLGVPRQQVAPGRVAEGACQGPCGDPAATEGERVVEGAAADRQVPGAVDPAHPYGAHGVGSLPACAGTEPNPSHTAKRCRPTLVSRGANASPFKLQEACDAKANHRGRCVMNATDERDKEDMGRESPEVPGVDDRRARPGRGCRNGQHGPPRPVAGRDDDREPRSPVFVTARCTSLQQPGSGPCAASCHRGFRHGERHGESRGASRAQDGPPSWLPLRELSSWSDYADHTTAIRGRLQGFLGAKTKAVILGVAHGGAVSDIGHAESARWLRALSRESRLLRWIACSNFGLLYDQFIEAKKP